MNLIQEPKYDAIDGQIVNRATGVAIPPDEPLIIFRAKDRNAIKAMLAYISECQVPHHKHIIRQRVHQFMDWQTANPSLVREPDTAVG